MKRSPHLVPYSKVDDAIKKANRYVLNGSCGICIVCVCSIAFSPLYSNTKPNVLVGKGQKATTMTVTH
jgi:hypothetical protein